jgi:hypothetical protein
MVSRVTLVLAALVLAAASGGGSYVWGRAAGRAAEKARQDADMVRQLGAEIDAQRGLIRAANDASAGLRNAQAALQAQERQHQQEFHHDLKNSAADRAGCRFHDGIVRHLAAARERAAHAAAGGGAATVPGTGPGAQR